MTNNDNSLIIDESGRIRMKSESVFDLSGYVVESVKRGNPEYTGPLLRDTTGTLYGFRPGPGRLAVRMTPGTWMYLVQGERGRP